MACERVKPTYKCKESERERERERACLQVADVVCCDEILLVGRCPDSINHLMAVSVFLIASSGRSRLFVYVTTGSRQSALPDFLLGLCYPCVLLILVPPTLRFLLLVSVCVFFIRVCAFTVESLLLILCVIVSVLWFSCFYT